MASIHAIRVELALTSCRDVEVELGDDLADSFAMVYFFAFVPCGRSTPPPPHFFQASVGSVPPMWVR